MDGSMDMKELLTEISREYLNAPLLSEPHGRSFIKHYATDEPARLLLGKAIVPICNSHGIQFKNDISFPLHWWPCNKGSSANDAAPVLSGSHLMAIDTYDELLAKLRELPHQWTVIQITKVFDEMDVVGVAKKHFSGDPAIYITKLPCGEALDTVPPYCVHIQPSEYRSVDDLNIIQKLEELMEQRRQFYSNPRDRKLQHVINATDSGLASCLTEIEGYWTREWRCLLNGRLTDSKLEAQVRESVKSMLRDAGTTLYRDRVYIDILLSLVINAHHIKDREILRVLEFIFDKDAVDKLSLSALVDSIKSLNGRDSSAIKNSEKLPVILVTDASFEFIPWEMTASLVNNPVCRILSFSMLYAVFKYHESHIKDGYRELPVDSAYCLLNPGKDLESCEKRMKKFLKQDLPWIEVQAGVVPEASELAPKLCENSLFLYCGHGSGSMYVNPSLLKKTPVDGVVFLYGCCSSLPRGNGGRTPYQNNTYTYLANGCPSLIGALYEISSTDADLAGISTLSNMLPTVTDSAGVLTVVAPREPDVLKAFLSGRNACSKFCTKCALVVRGIPVRVVFSDAEKTRISEKIKK